MEELTPDPKLLLELAETRMPFGKYSGRLLIDLPEPYVVCLTWALQYTLIRRTESKQAWFKSPFNLRRHLFVPNSGGSGPSLYG